MVYEAVDTPYVAVDPARVRANIARMQAAADRLRVALRPHIKTHKSVAVARMQLAAGAAGITCAKVSEAEVFAQAGIDDIFIAYPLIGESKPRRALAIQRNVKRLIVAADSVAGARDLSRLAERESVVFETRLEIDTGAGRTGLPLGGLGAAGAEIARLPGLRVTGVYTFKGLLYENEATLDAAAAGAEEAGLLYEAAEVLRGAGLPVREISAGSTPTGLTAAQTGLVSEIRPGTYVYNDYMTMRAGLCGGDDVAAWVCATVVSTPAPHLAVVDAGAKTLAADVRLNAPPYHLPGFALVAGRADLILDRLNEEHGMIRAARGGETGLRVGEILRLIPAHICTVINLHDRVYAPEGGAYRAMPVDARGRSQ